MYVSEVTLRPSVVVAVKNVDHGAPPQGRVCPLPVLVPAGHSRLCCAWLAELPFGRSGHPPQLMEALPR